MDAGSRTNRGTGGYRYRTADILLVGAIAAVGGVVSAYVIVPWAKFIEGLLGPFGAVFDNPFFIFWAIVAALLIRKPGVGVVTSVLTGAVEVLVGSADGSIVLIVTLLQGLGVELGFLLFRYRATLPAAIAAGAGAGLGASIALLYVFGFFQLATAVQIPFIIALMAGDAIIGGLLAWAIAQGVIRTGVWGGGGAYQRVDRQT
jgi:energy-coupling factor transport system substrate-specific component